MEFLQETRTLSQIEADILVVGIFQDESVGTELTRLDPGFPPDFVEGIAAICAQEGFTGKSSQSVHLPSYGKIASAKLILKGLGKQAEYGAASMRKAVGALARRLTASGACKSVAFHLRATGRAAEIQAAIEGWILGSYTFSKYKSAKETDKKPVPPARLSFVAPDLGSDEFERLARKSVIIADAANFARDLIAEPAAHMTPTRLAETAQALASADIACEIMDAAAAEAAGMGAFLGVSRGACEPPRFIVMRYRHPEAKKLVAIVGKGITFDSGGLSLKSAQGMENMKYDMSGAAAVIATMKAVSALKPVLSVLAVAAATENMPSGTATHPGDVLVAMNGKSIEVNNTDAEGRLVLADALCFAAKEKPDEVIDLATLTGAVVTALGRAAAGIMGNNDQLLSRLIAAGADAGEKFWQLPLFEEYKDSLKSDIADLKNAGSKGEASSSCAGMFLKEFVNGCPWAHLDIAGPAWSDKDRDEVNKGGTAFGVRTLCYYLLGED